MNTIMLIGRLGKDPEMVYTPQGTAHTRFPLATNRRWSDRTSGERKQETTWHTIVLWDALAEIAATYLHKGELCFVEGRLTHRDYTDKDGVRRRMYEVIADGLELLGGKPAASGDDELDPGAVEDGLF